MGTSSRKSENPGITEPVPHQTYFSNTYEEQPGEGIVVPPSNLPTTPQSIVLAPIFFYNETKHVKGAKV